MLCFFGQIVFWSKGYVFIGKSDVKMQKNIIFSKNFSNVNFGVISDLPYGDINWMFNEHEISFNDQDIAIGQTWHVLDIGRGRGDMSNIARARGLPWYHPEPEGASKPQGFSLFVFFLLQSLVNFCSQISRAFSGKNDAFREKIIKR